MPARCRRARKRGARSRTLRGGLRRWRPEAQFSNGFFVSVPSDDAGSQLWIRDEGAGDPESVIRFVKICAAEFSLSGHWGFQYSNMCSKQRLDGFGGGAHVLDLATGETIAWIDTEGWLAQTIADAGGKS